MSAVGPVVIALDGSPHSTRTLERGVEEAPLRGADVVLAHALRDPADIRLRRYPLLADVRFDVEAQKYLDGVLRRAPGRRPAARARRFQGHGQVLVVGSRTLGAFRGMLLGSVSSEVLRDADGTVLVVHPPCHADAEVTGR